MDGGESAEKPAHSDEDEGFTMNFSIEVVEDVAEQVGEMMRLGALGSFKQAREVSDSIDPVNLSTFAVVAEQMRLLFDQGDYTALLEKTKDIGMQLKLTEVQTKMVGTMEKIANAYLWSQSQPDDSEVHDLSYITTLRAAIGHITYLIEQKEVDMEALISYTLEVHFLLRSVQNDVDYPVLPGLNLSKGSADLALLASRLLNRGHYWTAEVVLELCCFPTKFHGWPQDDESLKIWPDPGLSFFIDNLQYHDASSPESRLARVSLAQNLCEKLQELRCVDTGTSRGKPRAMIRKLLQLQDEALMDPTHSHDYGSRCMFRYRLITLDEKAADSLAPEGIPFTKQDFTEMSLIHDIAQHNDDHILTRLAKSRIKNPEAEYVVSAYLFNNRHTKAPYVTLNLLPLPKNVQTVSAKHRQVAHMEAVAPPIVLDRESIIRTETTSVHTENQVQPPSSPPRQPSNRGFVANWTRSPTGTNFDASSEGILILGDDTYSQMLQRYTLFRSRIERVRHQFEDLTELREADIAELRNLESRAKYNMEKLERKLDRYAPPTGSKKKSLSLKQRYRWELFDRQRLSPLVDDTERIVTEVEAFVQSRLLQQQLLSQRTTQEMLTRLMVDVADLRTEFAHMSGVQRASNRALEEAIPVLNSVAQGSSKRIEGDTSKATDEKSRIRQAIDGLDSVGRPMGSKSKFIEKNGILYSKNSDVLKTNPRAETDSKPEISKSQLAEPLSFQETGDTLVEDVVPALAAVKDFMDMKQPSSATSPSMQDLEHQFSLQTVAIQALQSAHSALFDKIHGVEGGYGGYGDGG